MTHDALAWDIFEEHLDEAAFRRQLWQEALRAPSYSLAEIAAGPEERMLAHLDGLVRGGLRVARRLLLPALASDEPGVAFAAAFSLLASEEGDFLAEVLRALQAAEPKPRAALRRALAVVPVPTLGPRLVALVPTLPAVQDDLLAVLGDLRLDPGLRLEPLLSSREPHTQALALRLSAWFPGRLAPDAAERALQSPEPEVRARALESALVNRTPGAFSAAEATVAGQGRAFATAALLLGLSGDDKSVAVLASALKDAQRGRGAAFALGFSGRVSAVEVLLPALEDEKLGPAAAEAFAAITGLSVTKRFVRQGRPTPAEGEAEEAYGPEADLPRPDAEAIQRWWTEAKRRFEPAQRWLRGKPWSPEELLRELESGPARRREALCLELAVRSRGVVQVAWDGLSARQRAEMQEARSTLGRAAQGSFRDAAGPSPRGAVKAAPVVAVTPLRRNTPVPADALAVTGLGLVTSLGEGAAACCAAARAGVTRPRPLEDVEVIDEDEGEAAPVTVHSVEASEGFVGLGKLVRLGGLGLSSLLADVELPAGGRTGLFIAVGSDWLLSEADLERELPLDRLGAQLAEHLEVAGGIAEHRVFPADAPGLVTALAAARAALGAGRLDRCIVGGVDSLAEPLLVEALSRLSLLKTPDEPTGLMPGEGAGFLLVETAEAARRRKAPVRAWIDALALRTDAPTSNTGAAMEGTALAAVLSEVLAGRGGDVKKLWLCDLNGTTGRALDWGHALLRVPRAALEGASQWIPALHFGELGAATGPAAVALAAEGFARGRSPSRDAVLWLWSDAGQRGALLVRAP